MGVAVVVAALALALVMPLLLLLLLLMLPVLLLLLLGRSLCAYVHSAAFVTVFGCVCVCGLSLGGARWGYTHRLRLSNKSNHVT